MGHGTSGDALMCLKSALVHHVLYLREQGATHSKNLATFKRWGRWVNTTPAEISITLKYTVRFIGPSLGFTPKYMSAQYLYAAGDMDLLCSGAATNIIKLVGRWRSDEVP